MGVSGVGKVQDFPSHGFIGQVRETEEASARGSLSIPFNALLRLEVKCLRMNEVNFLLLITLL